MTIILPATIEPPHVRGSRARCSPDASDDSKNVPGRRIPHLCIFKRCLPVKMPKSDCFYSLVRPELLD